MNKFDQQNDTDNDDKSISKSQRKRDMHDLQALGTRLIDLTAAQLKKFALPESLYDAIVSTQNIHSNGARKRQLQYIGKLMRNIDPEPIRLQLEGLKSQSVEERQHFHMLEALRDKLISEGDEGLPAVLQKYPDADRQRLRQLVRSARQEQSEEKTPRAARALFQYLRELTEH